MKNNVTLTAKNFIKKDLKKKIDFDTITEYLKTKGYIVVFYDKNKENELLDKLDLLDYSKTVSAFTVRRNDVKFIFIDSCASSEDKLYLLLHETGHILLNHMNTNELTVNLRLQEIEADAFTHEVLHPRKKKRIFAPCLASILIGFILGGSFACTYLDVDTASVNDITYVEEGETETSTESELETEYVLVTPSGTKFHRSDCRYVKGKECTEYIREDALNKYAPCSVCKP